MTGDFPTRESIADHQLAQLRRLLTAVLNGNAFYRNKFAGLDPAIPSLEDFRRRFPFTTKAELAEDQRQRPPFGGNLSFPIERYTRFHQTSGTSSSPLRWLDTSESWNAMIESWKEIYRVAGIDGGDRVYFAFSFGPFIGFWLAFEAAQTLGCLCLPGGGLNSQGRVRAILDNQATALCCTPSYAARLAEVAAGARFPSLRSIIVAGEPGGSIPATRARLQKLWPGTRIFDHHGMTETGPVSYECPKQPGTLHILESAYLPEVVDGNGIATRPGETGELVLTTLGRLGSPVIRYRTGDLVRTANVEACGCGRRDMALAGGILGRSDDMFIVRGVNIYPTAVEDILGKFSEIAEFRVEVDRSGTLV
ncbi:MAG TPA: AMP-binding protein, partial [Verrucomicrobiae bacterium]|nr:AMP-binding protein [Verrucomicrobiae bacterium]